MRFARIFDFETGQLLLSISTENGVDGYVLTLATYCRGAFITTGLPFASFGDASEQMDELTHERAELIFQALTGIGKEPLEVNIIESSKAIEGFDQWLGNISSNRTENG